jgi:hypothetical protein
MECREAELESLDSEFINYLQEEPFATPVRSSQSGPARHADLTARPPPIHAGAQA